MAESPVRVLTAVPLCDGHDSAITAINLELIRNGIEVVYLGFHRSVADIVRAAVQEDVAAVGISSYNGGHIEFFREVSLGLREARRPDEQQAVLDALFFKCDVLWAQLDALHAAYVEPGMVPPGAFRPEPA